MNFTELQLEDMFKVNKYANQLESQKDIIFNSDTL